MPSIVVTVAPSAWTASIVQLFTALPSTWTVQAPHWLVSQPTWVPGQLQVLAEELDEHPSRLDIPLRAVPLTTSAMCSATAGASFPNRNGGQADGTSDAKSRVPCPCFQEIVQW